MKFNPSERRKHFAKAFLASPRTGYIIECGVGEGNSMRWLVTLAKGRPVYGFDSFEGLPEAWTMSEDLVVPAGAWAFEPPEIDGAEYVIGLFGDTLPQWKESHQDPVSFLHIDSDLYSSCATVLDELNEQIIPGTVIVFDDMFGTPRYKNWREGEYKAFGEWIEKYGRQVAEIDRTTDGEASYKIIL